MIEAWLRWLELERGALPETRKAYERELRRLAEAGEPSGLDTAALRTFIGACGGAPSTVARRIAALRSFYRYAFRSGARADDPTAQLDRPKVRRGLPRPIRDLPGVLAGLDPESRAIAVFLEQTGLRISEACSVEEEPPVPDLIVVRGKGSKDRLVPLTEKAQRALNELGGRLPVAARTIQRRFRRAGFTPHKLRHTFACDLAENGADLGEIQELLGHASPATTRIYTAYSPERLRRALERRQERN